MDVVDDGSNIAGILAVEVSWCLQLGHGATTCIHHYRTDSIIFQSLNELIGRRLPAKETYLHIVTNVLSMTSTGNAMDDDHDGRGRFKLEI